LLGIVSEGGIFCHGKPGQHWQDKEVHRNNDCSKFSVVRFAIQ
jgi:hypothetical protein